MFRWLCLCFVIFFNIMKNKLATKTTNVFIATVPATERDGTLGGLWICDQLVGEIHPRAGCFPGRNVFLMPPFLAKRPGSGAPGDPAGNNFHRCAIGGMAQRPGGGTLGVLCDPGLLRQAGHLCRNHAVRAPVARFAYDAPPLYERGRVAAGAGQADRDPAKETKNGRQSGRREEKNNREASKNEETGLVLERNQTKCGYPSMTLFLRRQNRTIYAIRTYIYKHQTTAVRSCMDSVFLYALMITGEYFRLST